MLMTIRENWLILPLCGVLTIAGLPMSGCEDATSREYTEVQATLESATTQFRRAEYNRVVSELTPVSGGAPGQQTARRLLLADAMRELGLAQLSQAEALEMQQARDRSAVRAKLAGLLRLEGRAAALAAVSTEPLRAELHAQRDAIDRQVRDLNQAIAELDGPISDRRAKIEQDVREVERLREQANDLLRQAMDLGHADGLASYKQGVGLRREADRIERRMALIEIELLEEFQPQRDAASLAIEHARSSLDDVQATLRELDEFDRLYKEQASGLQRAAGEFREKVNETLKAIAAKASNEIEPLYEQAVSQFERAASEASRATGAAGAMTEARCREALGRAHWTRARGLADHAALLASIVASGPAVGNVEGHAAQLESVLARQREAIEQASDAYQAAIAAVDRAGRVEGADAYRQSLQNAIDLLAGKEVDLTPPPVEMDLDFDFDMEDMPFDPSMLEAISGRDALLMMLDQMDFETVKQALEGMGMADPAMMDAMREPFTRAVQAVRERVERGEITDAQQLQDALMQEMMQRMGGFGG